MILKKLLVIHPFLFAVFPVLFIFAHNIDEVPPTDLLLPISVISIGTLVLFFSLRLIIKNYNKIGIITSCFLILFFSYGHVQALIVSLEPGRFIQEHVGLLLAPLWVLLLITGAFLVIKSRSNFSTSTKFLNIVAITLVTISLINIGIYEVKAFNLRSETTTGSPSSLDLEDSRNLPDIYYIILDGYAGASTLKGIYNYDNSEFINYLTNKGFYVASKSRSNYSLSLLSLSSSLNMEYINYLSDTVGIESTDETIPYRMLQNNKVSQFLKSVGYRYIAVFTIWELPGVDQYADVYLQKEAEFLGVIISNFSKSLIRSTPANYFVSPFIKRNDRGAILYAFDVLADVPNIKEPTFVFAHIHSPMGPFVFDRYGNSVIPIGKHYTEEEIGGKYLDQLIFINKKVKALVDEILSKSGVAPIIILQGDHGPPYSWVAELGVVQPNLRRTDILNAYFLPENGDHLLYESITPVNSFRIVFNFYFDTNYDLLEDKSYFSSKKYPYKFFLAPPEGNAD